MFINIKNLLYYYLYLILKLDIKFFLNSQKIFDENNGDWGFMIKKNIKYKNNDNFYIYKKTIWN